MNLAPALPLTLRPILAWQGFDAIGQKAKIEGDPERGFDCSYYNEDRQTWQQPSDIDQYRWIIEAFLSEMVTEASKSRPAH